jgi:death-on-curing protein
VGLLEAALHKPQARYGGADLYEGVFYKAAVLLECVVHSHPFVDGNKRTAFATAVRFLHKNGYTVHAKNVPDTMVDVASGVMNSKQLTSWLEQHTKHTSKSV